jgi:integrase/recombinase XerD
VKQLVERYLRHLTIERGLSKNSLAAYRRDLERYTGFLAERGIDDPASISVGDTQAFMSWLRDPDELDMSASSAARIASSVRGFHRFLDDEGVVDGDVASELKAPKQARRLPKALTIDEVQRLLDAAGGDAPEQLRDRALLEVLYASGARISEAVGLAVDDVIDRDMVRVRGKGDKQRVVPLGSYAQAALGAYLVRARPIFAAKGKGPPCFSGCAAVRCRGIAPGTSCSASRSVPSCRRTCRRTRCDTRSRHTSCRAGRMCASCRSCSATRRCRRRRSTRR